MNSKIIDRYHICAGTYVFVYFKDTNFYFTIYSTQKPYFVKTAKHCGSSFEAVDYVQEMVRK